MAQGTALLTYLKYPSRNSGRLAPFWKDSNYIVNYCNRAQYSQHGI